MPRQIKSLRRGPPPAPRKAPLLGSTTNGKTENKPTVVVPADKNNTTPQVLSSTNSTSRQTEGNIPTKNYSELPEEKNVENPSTNNREAPENKHENHVLSEPKTEISSSILPTTSAISIQSINLPQNSTETISERSIVGNKSEVIEKQISIDTTSSEPLITATSAELQPASPVPPLPTSRKVSISNDTANNISTNIKADFEKEVKKSEETEIVKIAINEQDSNKLETKQQGEITNASESPITIDLPLTPPPLPPSRSSSITSVTNESITTFAKTSESSQSKELTEFSGIIQSVSLVLQKEQEFVNESSKLETTTVIKSEERLEPAVEAISELKRDNLEIESTQLTISEVNEDVSNNFELKKKPSVKFGDDDRVTVEEFDYNEFDPPDEEQYNEDIEGLPPPPPRRRSSLAQRVVSILKKASNRSSFSPATPMKKEVSWG